MASKPPIVQWMIYDADSGQFVPPNPYKWDAGIVEAGSSSDPQTFFVWNNYKGAQAGTEADKVPSDMINVRISVRDENGETDDGRICNKEQATVSYKMGRLLSGSSFNGNEKITYGLNWGSYNAAASWTQDAFEDLDAATPKPINAAASTFTPTANGGKISGATNNGDPTAAATNYAAVQLRLTAKSNADAGTIKWITRVSYQYT